MEDQLAFDLFDLGLAAPWKPAPVLCSACGTPAVAKVYGFTWYPPRRAYLTYLHHHVACASCLEQVTAEVRAALLETGKAYKLVWSHVPLADPIPGTDFAWHEVETVAP